MKVSGKGMNKRRKTFYFCMKNSITNSIVTIE